MQEEQPQQQQRSSSNSSQEQQQLQQQQQQLQQVSPGVITPDMLRSVRLSSGSNRCDVQQQQQQQQMQVPSKGKGKGLLPPPPKGRGKQQAALSPGLQQRMPAQPAPRMSRRRPVPPPGPPSLSPGLGKALAEDFHDDDELAASGAAAADVQPEPELLTQEGVAAALSVATRVEYSALPRGTRQDVFGLVTVTAAEPPEEEPSTGGEAAASDAGMDIVCVLDVSGSMTGEKIRLLQEAVRFVIEQAHDKDRISIVTFNSTAARTLRLRRMVPEGKSEATAAALRLVAGGGTSIASGLDTGIAIMEQRRSRNKVSAVLLLTDGQDHSSRARLPELVERCRVANCSLYAFGFGKDHDAALLSSVAEQARTPFTFVEDVEHIREAFAGTVGGLSSVVAQGIELHLASRVPLKAVHTPFEVRRISDTHSTVLIPDIFGGESRDVLVELDVPMEGAEAASGAGLLLLEAHVRYTDLKRNVAVQTPVATMETQRVDEPQPEMEPDEEVSAQRERVEVARALKEAAAQSDRCDFEGARQALQSQANALKAKKKATRMSPALLLELEDASSRMASRAAWEAGGRAEVQDSFQMHMTQRCTNMSVSKNSAVQKCSKGMYLGKKAKAKISSLGTQSDSD